MKRKVFLRNMIYGLGGVTLLGACSGKSEAVPRVDTPTPDPIKTSGKVRLGIITDVHHDFFPDAEERLSKFIRAAEAAQVDFIIQLGDFVYPAVKNTSFVNIWNSFKGKKYHALGNHDMDAGTKSAFMSFVGHNLGAHYSFDAGGFHFVVLDNNFIKQGNTYVDYANKNYTNYAGSAIAHVSPSQIEWLREDLSKTDKPSILFSHQPLNNSISNSQEVLGLIREENKKGKKVIAAFSGHLHKNWSMAVDDVHHVQINSASYFYVNPEHPKYYGRYPKDVEDKYPILPQMAPYDDSLFAIVEIDGPSRTLNIEGRNANFMPPSPYDLGYYTNQGQTSPSSNVDSRALKF